MIGDSHNCALNSPVLCQDCVDALRARLAQAEADTLTLALRVYGESESSLSPECRAVMQRLHAKVDALLRGEPV